MVRGSHAYVHKSGRSVCEGEGRQGTLGKSEAKYRGCPLCQYAFSVLSVPQQSTRVPHVGIETLSSKANST